MDKDNISENLKDAGCDSLLIEEFFRLDMKGQLNLLSKHKSKLLQNLREAQKRIDCLDYLVFNLQHQLKIEGE